MTAIPCRPARLEDAGEIHALLLTLAPEIPLLVDTLEREEALYALVRNCARSGESWVAVDNEERIVGFALAEATQFARHYAEHETIELRYAGVAPAQRNRGIFGRLVAHVLDRMVPVTATVAPQNRAAAARLRQRGFVPVDAAGGGQRLHWEPGRS